MTTPRPLGILDRDVELVEEYKYLGVNIDNQLNWRTNSTAVHKKGCRRLCEKTQILQCVQQDSGDVRPGCRFKVKKSTSSFANMRNINNNKPIMNVHFL